MGGVDPVVGSPAHNMIACDLELVDRDLCVCGQNLRISRLMVSHVAVRRRIDVASVCHRGGLGACFETIYRCAQKRSGKGLGCGIRVEYTGSGGH
jgi:hypothetical protein